MACENALATTPADSATTPAEDVARLFQWVAAPRQRLAAQALQRVTSYIDGALASELRLADLAAIAGLSVSHFATLFRASTGESVHQYVMRRRVERAQRLLQSGGMSVCAVALETGFSHQSHLARWMRRLRGATPAAFLREGADVSANDETLPHRRSA
jgi:AraC family transcriptional regulator